MKQPTLAKVRLPKKKPDPVAPFPEHAHVCLNCGSEVSNYFCSICGQSTATHRLSFSHFVLHDLIHSIWHVDRGIFFTLKEVLIRPGYASLEYIRGKRAGRFPILTLLVLLIGLALWLYSLDVPGIPHRRIRVDGEGTGPEIARQFFSFFSHNAKWLLLGLLPVGSLSASIIFRRTRLNYAEQLLLNSYVFAGLLLLLIVFRLIVLGLPATAVFFSRYEFYVGFLFYLFGYWQAYHRAYRLRSVIWLYFLHFVLTVSLLGILVGLWLAAALFTNPQLRDATS